ncbi:AT-hook motif nuclear-localized protein 7-like [Lotus japonicus]|uniref:AT-hook motif nuclear-localized protein 7-like n=1 Tax=Lotus japonicus TaxID=34305 RepID=UPI0025875ECE|nr:AT-hook motif nuclear-localized protein 7-like [Lotus japonicus]
MSSSRGGGDGDLIGSDFRTHMILANDGEDIIMEIGSLVRRGSRAICILSAHGTISNITFRHASFSRHTLTYEVIIGSFEVNNL